MPQSTITLFSCILFFYSSGYKQQNGIEISHFNTTNQKLVGDGYDLVSYFSEKEPVKGKPTYDNDFEQQKWVKVELYRFGGNLRTNNSDLIRFCKKHTLT